MKKKIISFVLFFLFWVLPFSFLIAQAWLWSNYGVGDGFVTSVASATNGNCYILGGFSHDTIHFGGYTVSDPAPTNRGWSDLFLVKLDHNGNIIWVKQTFYISNSPTASLENNPNVHSDLAGNTYIASDFQDTLIIGTNTLVCSKGNDSYVVKLDSSGNVKWSEHSSCRDTNGNVGDEFTTCDLKGNVYLSGVFGDTISFGADTLIATTIWGNTYLVKYDSSGNVKWVIQSKGHTVNGHICYSNANDKFGNSFITGGFGDTLIFGSDTLFSPNTINCFLAKYDSSGNVVWAKQNMVLSGGSAGYSLATDQTGNVYAAGDFMGKVIFGNDTLISPTNGSFFIIKYAPNGNVVWVKQATVLDNNTWSAWSLSIDNYKQLYLSANGGYGQCKITFGGVTVSMYDTAKYDGASVIFKLDSNGKVLCSAITPVSSTGGIPNAIASDTSGRYVYFGGGAGTIAIFGKDTVNPFSVPIDAIWQQNFFPFVARWQACDTYIFSTVIQKENSGEEVVLYPNPNNGKAELGITNYELGMKYNLGVYDIFGRQIETQSITSKQTTIDLSNQPNGIYFYRVFNEKEIPIGQGKTIIEK